MKVCNVVPHKDICMACIDNQIEYRQDKECSTCNWKTEEYELIDICISFFGTPYAIVQRRGKPEKVPLERVHNIREV